MNIKFWDCFEGEFWVCFERDKLYLITEEEGFLGLEILPVEDKCFVTYLNDTQQKSSTWKGKKRNHHYR